MRRIEDTTNESVKKRVLGSYGYFGGGAAPGSVSRVDRIDYSNDTATASVRGPLSLIVDRLVELQTQILVIMVRGGLRPHLLSYQS
jgi:hypothetical protein